MRNLFLPAVALLASITLGDVKAYAAKGVKKSTTATQTHHLSGVITQIHHHKGKTSAGSATNVGQITIKSHHSKKKGTQATAGKKHSNTHTITVGANTKIGMKQGKGAIQASNFSALKVGEHVKVSATKNHATSIEIMKHSTQKKTNSKKTTANKTALAANAKKKLTK